MKETENKSAYTLHVDRELWKQFKSRCAAEGISILDKINQLIKSFLEK